MKGGHWQEREPKPSLYLRALCFLLVPPVYVWLWCPAWFDSYTWLLGWRSAWGLHRQILHSDWKRGLDVLVASAVQSGGRAVDIRAALVPYTPKEEDK
jgi:hypothetical protein